MADAPHPDAWRTTVRRRLAILAVIFALWAATNWTRFAALAPTAILTANSFDRRAIANASTP